MIEQNRSKVRTATWEGRRFHVVPMDPDRRSTGNLFTLEMEDGAGTMVVVDTDDRKLESGELYAYLTREKTLLWACGDGEPPDGEVVGSVVSILYSS
jgi:hypothetical protein